MDTRGIVHSRNVGRRFSLERRVPPDDLAGIVDDHWIVAWSLPEGAEYRSAVLPHPCAHLVAEPHGVSLYGIPGERDVRVLSGSGWAVGTKLRPGGLAGLTAIAPAALRGQAVPVTEAFGAAGAALAAVASASPSADSAGPPVEHTLTAVHALLRARRPSEPDPRAELVGTVARAMRAAPPGTTVAQLAAAHHVTPRTLQRLFATYVGVSPKWVLQRYRLHDALDRIDRTQPVDWSRFAIELGYYDQAHFSHDFRAAIGMTPGEYAAAA